MSGTVDPTGGAPAPTNVTNQPEAAASTGSAEGDYTSDTKVSTIGDVKKIAPKLYDSMMQGIAMSIISRMRKSQARLKKLMREMRR